jgi:hypothetical protein
MPPEVIAGRYHVERVVGHGGMGSVWLCTDELLGRKVAVKQVGTMPGETTLDVARALREARTSAALQHRNVVSIYDAVEEGDDRIWLVMEYVPGRTLAQILADEGSIPPERAVWIMEQVAEGLAAAHARGTIHRDVKPGNILVTADDVAKIGDFGIARTTGDPELTRAGLVTGTPAYFSPEVARGEPPTPAADVWALGATLYVAVEGRPMFPEQTNPIALLGVIASTSPPRPEHAGFLSEAIARMLDQDPGSRWSMTDAAYVLRRLRERHAAVDTRAVTKQSAVVSPPAEAPPVEAAPPVSAPAVSAPASAPAASAPASARAVPAPVATRPGGRRDRGGRLLVTGLVALLLIAAVGGFLLLRDVGPFAGNGDTARQASGRTSDSPAAQPTRDTKSPTSTPSAGLSASPEGGATGGASLDPSTSPSAGSPIPASSSEQFVAGYYSALPGDTADGWASLSPQFQQRVGSYDRYRGFWGTIRAVTVNSTEPVGSRAVDVSLTYTTDDGHTPSEVRRLYLEPSGDGYLISRDKIVG